ncbi:unnamed protein product, partial [Adineta steineri]
MAAVGNVDPLKYTRVSDIVKEPVEMLMPIEGYEQMPIVSLREAVAPLLSILPKIQDYADIVKKRCKPVPPDGLTRDESASIMLYSMDWEPNEECLSFALNAALRTEDRKELKPWFSYLKLLLTALEKLPSTSCNVVRAMNLDLSNQYSVRKTFVWWGFSSCTTSIEVLEKEEILGKTGQRTVFTIECDSGKDIIGCFEQAQGLHIILLKETMPPFTLLQPVTNQSAQIRSTPEQIQTKKNKYQQFAITVAGGNGPGHQLYQLFNPWGMFIDNNKSIYIADFNNHRIVKWKLNSNTSRIIADGNGYGNESSQLGYPRDIIFHKNNDSFIISDKGNKRVIQCYDQNQQIIIPNIHCYGLTIDKDGFIYVSDYMNHEVRRWKQGDKKGELVAGGNRKGNHLNQLNNPTYIFIDDDYSLYISDTDNHRVMRWCEGDKEGEIVVGGNHCGSQSNELYFPTGLSFDNE